MIVLLHFLVDLAIKSVAMKDGNERSFIRLVLAPACDSATMRAKDQAGA